MPLNEHPLLMMAYELSIQVDKLPAHKDQTKLITDLGQWRDQLYEHLKKHGLLRLAADGAEQMTNETKGVAAMDIPAGSRVVEGDPGELSAATVPTPRTPHHRIIVALSHIVMLHEDDNGRIDRDPVMAEVQRIRANADQLQSELADAQERIKRLWKMVDAEQTAADSAEAQLAGVKKFVAEPIKDDPVSGSVDELLRLKWHQLEARLAAVRKDAMEAAVQEAIKYAHRCEANNWKPGEDAGYVIAGYIHALAAKEKNDG